MGLNVIVEVTVAGGKLPHSISPPNCLESPIAAHGLIQGLQEWQPEFRLHHVCLQERLHHPRRNIQCTVENSG